MYLTDTNHMIDDEKLTHDNPLDLFLDKFPLKPDYIDPDGKCWFTFKGDGPCKVWMCSARKLISSLGLPLEVDMEQWSRNGKVFEVNMVIEIKRK